MTDYSGTVSQSAVSADIHTRVSMTSTLAHMIHEKSLNLYYTADKDGIKLWNKDNTGTSAKLDEKSWQDLRIVKVSTDPTDPSKNKDGWDWGNNAAASKGEPQLLYSWDPNQMYSGQFSFAYTWTPDYNLGFGDTSLSIQLPIAIADVARDQSVYFALDQMPITQTTPMTDYQYQLNYSGTAGTYGKNERLIFDRTYGPTISFEDEYNNCERYKDKNNAFSNTTPITLNTGNWDMSFTVKKQNSADTWYTMTGNASSAYDKSKDYIGKSLDYTTALARINFINGTDTTKESGPDISVKNTVVYGYYSTTYYSDISFSKFTSLDELNNKGFSIDNTNYVDGFGLTSGCTIRFTSKQADELDYSTTGDGRFRYKVYSGVPTGDILMIDLDSLKNSGVTLSNGGEQSLAYAIRQISRESNFDSRLSASSIINNDNGLTLSSSWRFECDDKPFASPTHGVYRINFSNQGTNTDTDGNNTPGSKSWNMIYAYDYADFADQITFNVSSTEIDDTNVSALSGDDVLYQKVTENSGNTYQRLGTVSMLRAANRNLKGLYRIDVKYMDKDSNADLSKDAVINKTANMVLPDIIKHTETSVSSGANSTTFFQDANENIDGNVAVRVLNHTEIETENNSSNSIAIQHSSNVGDTTILTQFPMNTAFLSLGNTNTRTIENANRAMSRIDLAINRVSAKRAYFGSVQNRLEHAIHNNEVMTENMVSAESRIRDTDMAKSVASLTKDQILSQAAQAMLAQANQLLSSTLKLLQ